MSIESTGRSKDDPRKPLLTDVLGACAMLNLCRDVVYELLASGEIESFLVGRARRISVASIERYIRRRLSASKGRFVRARYLSNPAEDASI